MKSKKDLREDAIGQDDRKNEKVRGNSVRSFAVLTLFAVLAMVISLGTKVFLRIHRMRKWQFLPELQELLPEFRIHCHPAALSPGSEAPVSR